MSFSVSLKKHGFASDAFYLVLSFNLVLFLAYPGISAQAAASCSALVLPAVSTANHEISRPAVTYLQKIYAHLKDGYSSKAWIDEEIEHSKSSMDLNLAWAKEQNLVQLLGRHDLGQIIPEITIDAAFTEKLIAHHTYFYQTYLAALQKALNKITPGAWHLREMPIPFHPEKKVASLVYTMRHDALGQRPKFEMQAMAFTSPLMIYGLLLLRQIEAWASKYWTQHRIAETQLNFVIQDFNLPLIQTKQSFAINSEDQSLEAAFQQNYIHLPPEIFLHPLTYQPAAWHEFVHYLLQGKMNFLYLQSSGGDLANPFYQEFSLSEIAAYLTSLKIYQQQAAWAERHPASSLQDKAAFFAEQITEIKLLLPSLLDPALVALRHAQQDLTKLLALLNQSDVGQKQKLLAHPDLAFSAAQIAPWEQNLYAAQTAKVYQIGQIIAAEHQGKTLRGEIYNHSYPDEAFLQTYQSILRTYPSSPDMAAEEKSQWQHLALQEALLRRLGQQIQQDLHFLQEAQTYLAQGGDGTFPKGTRPTAQYWALIDELTQQMIFPDTLAAVWAQQFSH